MGPAKMPSSMLRPYHAAFVEQYGPHMAIPSRPTIETIYVSLLPYCRANGCQKSKDHPARRMTKPVPDTRTLSSSPLALDKGTRAEY